MLTIEKRGDTFVYTKDSGNSFGVLLSIARKCRQVSQTELAKRMNDFVDPENESNTPRFKRTQVSRWEKGKAIPNMKNCIAICGVLNIDINFLFGVTNKLLPDDIQQKTGLSQESFRVLDEWHNNSNVDLAQTINYLLTDPGGLEVLRGLNRIIDNKKNG